MKLQKRFTPMDCRIFGGDHSTRSAAHDPSGYDANGAFTRGDLSAPTDSGANWTATARGYNHVYFNATRSNAIYGKANHVQPKTVGASMWQRVK